MRTALLIAALVALIAASQPANAQYRKDVPAEAPPAKVYNDAPRFSLDRLFSPEYFQMRHSYELSFGSYGGGLSLGEYTNTMLWRFSPKVAARLDVGLLHTPFGAGPGMNLPDGQQNFSKLYLKNAEISYRPSQRMAIHLSVRQSPYGRYLSPYGSPYYGYNRAFEPGYYDPDRLFWKRSAW
jgi:hypothetical protein